MSDAEHPQFWLDLLSQGGNIGMMIAVVVASRAVTWIKDAAATLKDIDNKMEETMINTYKNNVLIKESNDHIVEKLRELHHDIKNLIHVQTMRENKS